MIFDRGLIVLLTLLTISSASYDPIIAQELVYMSAIAYENVSSINDWSCDYCKYFKVDNVNAFSNIAGDLQMFAAYSVNLKGIVLAFRGSDNIANWITDLTANKVDYPKCTDCQVHNGFYKAWGLAQ